MKTLPTNTKPHMPTDEEVARLIEQAKEMRAEKLNGIFHSLIADLFGGAKSTVSRPKGTRHAV